MMTNRDALAFVGLTSVALAALAAPLALVAQDGRAFEVASIKPNPSGPGAINAQAGGRLTATNVTLRALIQNAYRLQATQIGGGPAWINTDRFDIAAKDDPDPARMPLMLRALLADRFKLAIAMETRETPIYALRTELKRPTASAAGGGR